jgi:hypothetical protein
MMGLRSLFSEAAKSVAYTPQELLDRLVQNRIDPTDFFRQADQLAESDLKALGNLIKEQIKQRNDPTVFGAKVLRPGPSYGLLEP